MTRDVRVSRRLEGKAALITGGAGGIGRVTARLFCEQGASVALVDVAADAAREAAREIEAQVPGAQVVGLAADISRAADAARAVEQALAALGRLTTLVNNAAVRTYFPLAEAPEASWQQILGVNLLGAAHCSKAALPALRQAAGASIVNVSSVFGVVGRKGMGQYDATKAGLLAITRTLAAEEAANGVRVNAVCPGSTWTPYIAGRAEARGMSEEELRRSGAVTSLLGRWGEPHEIAYPILWLASDEASFITGTTLVVDGGFSAV